METLKPQFKVVYQGKDISADVGRYLLALTYTDHTEGKADEIQLELEDTDGLWRSDWYPQKGDTVQVAIGYDSLVDCGTFEVDEIRLDGPPDRIVICGLSAAVKKKLRTQSSAAYESQTLKQIAQSIAGKNGLTVEGTIENIKIARVTQNRETDLGFLRRIAAEYGYLFSVRGTKLVFTSLFDIEKGKAVRELDRSELQSYSLTDKTSQTFKSAKVAYHNPVDNKVVEGEENKATNADGKEVDIATGDTLEIRTKAENQQQAEKKAKAALYRHNSKQQEGSFVIEGDPVMLAGNNFELTGMGTLSGKYHIETSRHTISASGYTTSLDVKRVGFVEKVKQAPKKPRKEKPYTVRVVQ